MSATDIYSVKISHCNCMDWNVPCPECHTLSNRRADSWQHSTTTRWLLHGCRSRIRFRSSCGGTRRGSCRASSAKTTTTSASTLLFVERIEMVQTKDFRRFDIKKAKKRGAKESWATSTHFPFHFDPTLHYIQTYCHFKGLFVCCIR